MSVSFMFLLHLALNSELFYEATILRKAITQHLLAYNIAILDRQRLGTAIAEDNKAKGKCSLALVPDRLLIFHES